MKRLLNKYLPLAYGKYFNVVALFSKESAAHKAFTLFCTPRKGRILPSQVAFLKSAENGIEEVSGHKLQTYSWAGDKETVLLLHGWESNSFRWRNLIGFLQHEDYNIITFDAPAHGKSSGKIFNVPLYTNCIQHMVQKYQPKFMVAHSVGGMAAIYHQYKYPQNSLKSIVTIGSPSELPEIMDQYKKTLNYNARVDHALDRYFVKTFGFGVNDFSTSTFAKELNIQGLLIHDKLDKIAPVQASERVHANWKNSTLITTEGFGHSLHQEEVSNYIMDFLR
ncbi:MAG: alpha/beta fold hydrolase [Flavobacteriaceae bacterium]